MLTDHFDPRQLDECANCNGSGQVCTTCSELVDNCECSDDGSTWIDCPDCNGEGVEENGLEICKDCDKVMEDCECGQE